MTMEPRVTLRCLIEDLTSGWTNADHQRAASSLGNLVSKHFADEISKSQLARHVRVFPRLNALSHPLLRHFSNHFTSEYDPSKLESISGLSNPHWWKQKTQQWRGAVTDHSSVSSDSAWLCAAGIRRDGDNSDFYKSFMYQVSNNGPSSFLPAKADKLLLEIDEKITAQDAWYLQIHCSTLALLAEARRHVGKTVTMEFTKPSRFSESEPIGSLSVSIIGRIKEGATELDEVFLAATILNEAEVASVDLAGQYARAAIDDDAEAWTSTTYVENSYAFSAIVPPSAIDNAELLETNHELPLDFQPLGLRIGLRSHYTYKDGIVNAQVEGSAIKSLCGYWFVPITDHENVEKCPRCVQRHKQLM
ncbi:DUF3039 domain-containing protein [Glutamicibacter ectropisis]|uniref:DUF3039 domain-containing protein n=1 Tax=Glutamicibacter ectropisis TaxID=3046593 RepID=A0AAU6WFH7_9MICC